MMSPAADEIIVVKAGGSLYDVPDLRRRLTDWITACGSRRMLVVPGGGGAADVIRHLYDVHDLGDEASHFLAIRAMGLMGDFLAALLGRDFPAMTREGNTVCCRRSWQAGKHPIILDTSRWAEIDACPIALPFSWDVTSDSIALQMAWDLAADRLVLLKSVDAPRPADWVQAAADGVVDEYFPNLLDRLPPDVRRRLRIEIVNLRQWVRLAGLT